MGRLVEGKWIVEEVNPKTKDGEYQRQNQKFRSPIAPNSPHPPEKDRYHLYVSHACPWAHRTMIMRSLKGLKDIISVSVVSPWMLDQGWEFDPKYEGSTEDHLYQAKYLKDLYVKADNNFSGRVTVPVLWDKKRHEIVNNESSEIIRIFNESFNEITKNSNDYYPEHLRDKIDEMNELTYESINNGVYKTGFAREQNAYEKHYRILFEALEKIEKTLDDKRDFLISNQLTEADIRLFTTLIRFDCVYYSHFKCNYKRIIDYPNLRRFTQKMMGIKEISETLNFDHIKTHYYGSHETLNPLGIIPLGPQEFV